MVYITCFTLKEKYIDAVFLLFLFGLIRLLQCSFSFLVDLLTGFGLFCFFEMLAIVTKCSVLDL